ncbi:MAG: PD-(D/E)XK motif protein, partial [bacterium]
MSELWEAISTPRDATRVSMRRVGASHPFDFFRARDHQGRYLLILEGNFAIRKAESLPTLAGIEIEMTRNESGTCSLRLTLLERSQTQTFGALCANLIRSTDSLNTHNDEAAVAAVVARLRRWQDLLRNRSEKVLTRPEQIGLFGELLVLRDVFLVHCDAASALSCWRGPESDEQDFIHSGWLIEVKTRLSTADSSVRISSENQLDTVSGSISLCNQRLSISADASPEARSLNGLVEEVRDNVEADAVAVDRLE